MSLQVTLKERGPKGRTLVVQDFEVSAGEPLTFGRAEGQNRLHVPDDKKTVSSRHGRIERRGNDYFVVDLGSTNGTLLDGRQVQGDAGEILQHGSTITIGDFELCVLPGEGRPAPSAGPAPDATLQGFDPDALAAEAWQALCAAFVARRGEAAGDRRKSLAAELRSRLGRMTPAQARSVLKRIAAQGGGAAAAAGPEEELLQGTMTGMQRLARALVPDRPLQTAGEVVCFVELAEVFFQLTMRWLAQSMQGRAEFENQFGAEVTLVFQRSNNPLKGLGADDLARHLMDWNAGRDRASLRHQLETVYRDLTQHQLGLLVGVKEAIRAVMERLSPEAIESLAQRDAGWLTSKGAKAWDVYRQIYSELLEEKSKLFHEVISPAIRQGYLQSHQDDQGRKTKE